MAESNSNKRSKTPWLFSLRSSYGFIIVTLAIAFFFDTLYYGLVIPILPRLLRKRVNVPDDSAQLWIALLLATYCVAQLLCAPVVGYMADRWSNRRLPLLGGLVALGVANAIFAFGRDVGLLVVARFLQGASGAVIWAVGLALLVDTVGTQNMAYSMSWVTISLSVGLTSGPVIGGIIYHRAGHYPVFIVAIALLIVDFVLRLMLIEKHDAKKILQSEDEEESTEENTGPTTESTNETSPLLAHELSISDQPKHSALWNLLTSIELLIGLWAIFIANLSQTSIEAVLPLYTQQTFNWTAENSALSLLAFMLPAFTGPIAGSLTDKYGPRINTILGLLTIGISYPCLALVLHNDTGSVVLLCVLLLILGTGISFVIVAQMSTVASFAENMEKESPGIFGSTGATAQSCSLINWAFATAGVVGPAVAGSLKQTLGWQVMCYVMGAVALVSILPMFRLRK